MSKIIEKLNDLGKTTLPAMGFRMTGGREKRLSMLVMVEITGRTDDEIENLANAGVVAEIVNSAGLNANTMTKYAKNAGGMIVGLLLSGQKGGNGWKLIKEDTDFIIFDINTPVSAFDGKELNSTGKILSLGLEIDSGILRSVQNMHPAIDAVIINIRLSELTMETMMNCRRIADFTGQHVLAFVNGTLSVAELLALREAGVKGLVLPPDVDIEAIRSIIDEIAKLPQPVQRKGKKDVVLLPKLGLAPIAKEDEGGDDGDE